MARWQIKLNKLPRPLAATKKPRNWTGFQQDFVSTYGLLVKLDEAREADRRAFDVAMAQ